MKQFLKRLMVGVVTLAMFCCAVPAAFAAGPTYYTINLERQGGEGTAEYIFVYRTKDSDGNEIYKTASLPTPKMDGYTFDGWYTDIVGGTVVNSDYKFKEDGQTIYAHWSVKPDTSTSTTTETTTKPESSFRLKDHIGTIVVLGTTVVVVTLAAMNG